MKIATERFWKPSPYSSIIQSTSSYFHGFKGDRRPSPNSIRTYFRHLYSISPVIFCEVHLHVRVGGWIRIKRFPLFWSGYNPAASTRSQRITHFCLRLQHVTLEPNWRRCLTKVFIYRMVVILGRGEGGDEGCTRQEGGGGSRFKTLLFTRNRRRRPLIKKKASSRRPVFHPSV